MVDGSGTGAGLGAALMLKLSTASAGARVLDAKLPMIKVMLVVSSPVQLNVPVPKSPGTEEVMTPPMFARSPLRDVGLPILNPVKNSSGGNILLTVRVNSLIGALNAKETGAGDVLSKSRKELLPNGWVLLVVRVTSMPPRLTIPPKGVPDPNEKSDETSIAETLLNEPPTKKSVRHITLITAHFLFIHAILF